MTYTANIIDGRIKLSSLPSSDEIMVEYGIATYKLDKGYQMAESNMSDSVRKLSPLHASNKILDYSTDPATEISLFNVPSDPEALDESNSPAILINVLPQNTTRVTINGLPLVYNPRVNGTFIIDGVERSKADDDTHTFLVTFTVETEATDYEDEEDTDGVDRYSDYLILNASESYSTYDFELDLSSVFNIAGYTSFNLIIDITPLTYSLNTSSYIILSNLDYLVDDRMISTAVKYPADRSGGLEEDMVISSPLYAQIFTDNLKDCYNVLDYSWMTIAAEGFDDYGTLVTLSKDEFNKIEFTERGSQFNFQSIPEARRLVDSLGFHLNAYSITQPTYLDGFVNLYAGKEAWSDGSEYVSNEFSMNWPYGSYQTPEYDTFVAGDYNKANFLLSTTPITGEEYVSASGSLYLHHRIDVDNSANIITEGLPNGYHFAVVIPNSTSRIEFVDIESIDQVGATWSWAESYQGYALLQSYFTPFNPSNLNLYQPSDSFVPEEYYTIIRRDDGSYLLCFNLNSVSSLRDSYLDNNYLQIDFHCSYTFDSDDFELLSDSNTYNAALHWTIPEVSLTSWSAYKYHPDLTSDTTVEISYSRLGEYAPSSLYKSSATDAFQFYPTTYNYTEVKFNGFTDNLASFSVDLTGMEIGTYEDMWSHVDPYQLIVDTLEGERWVPLHYIQNWEHDDNYPSAPIYTFDLFKDYFARANITILTDTNMELTYSYDRQTYEYTSTYRDILLGNGYDFVIKANNGSVLSNQLYLESVSGNTITLKESIYSALEVGENFTISYSFKTRGGLLESKHMYFEVQPWEMTFYDSYKAFSANSLIAPLFYNMSSNYLYYMGLNYRLEEETTRVLACERAWETDSEEFFVGDGLTIKADSDGEYLIVASFLDEETQEERFIDSDDVVYDPNLNIITVSNLVSYGIGEGDVILFTALSSSDNKYQFYHEFDYDLDGSDSPIDLKYWSGEDIEGNVESYNLIYDVGADIDEDDKAEGLIREIYAGFEDPTSDPLVYRVSPDLTTSSGWVDYDTLIVKLQIYDQEVVDHLEFTFLIDSSTTLGTAEVYPEDIDDSNTLYLKLPQSEYWSSFTPAHDARVSITPVYKDEEDFKGYFYDTGTPVIQYAEWDSSLVTELGYCQIDLEYDPSSECSSVLVYNSNMEFLYSAKVRSRDDTDSNGEEISVSYLRLLDAYSDSNDNSRIARDGDFYYLKYYADTDAQVYLTIGEMALNRKGYLPNYESESSNVPAAEISLLSNYNSTEDLYYRREKVVAWNAPLEITPFELSQANSLRSAVFEMNVSEFNPEFLVLSSDGANYSYISNVLITSNDPKYTLTVESFFIFEVANGTMAGSEYFDLYELDQKQEFYIGSFSDPWSLEFVVNATGKLPLYYFNSTVDETEYFEVFDDYGNYFGVGSQLERSNISSIYTLSWDSLYSEEFTNKYEYAENDTVREELIEEFGAIARSYNYLTVAWATYDSWKGWRTVNQYNINSSSLCVSFESYNESTEEYDYIYFEPSQDECEVVQKSIEYLYAYNIDSNSHEFELERDYSEHSDLGVYSVKGMYFNETTVELGIDSAALSIEDNTITITRPEGKSLSEFDYIAVVLNFTSGPFSDYTQFRLLENAIVNHPELSWSINDSLFVDYEYAGLDFSALIEDYEVGSSESTFELLNYTRNGNFAKFIDGEYVFDFYAQFLEVMPFVELNLTSDVMYLTDQDLDGSYEEIVEYTDVYYNNEYNLVKYGSETEDKEIVMDLTVFDVNMYSNVPYSDSSKLSTPVYYLNQEGFYSNQLSWERIIGQYTGLLGDLIVAKRTVRTSVYSETSSEEDVHLVQVDTDKDGSIDSEMKYYSSYSSTTSSTNEKDTTEIAWYSYMYAYATSAYLIAGFEFSNFDQVSHALGFDKPDREASIGAERDYTMYSGKSYSSITFTDYNANDFESIRLYEDIFPNELSDMYKMQNYATQAFGTESAEVITTYSLDSILSLRNGLDQVPGVYEKLTIRSGASVEASNYLEATLNVNLPGASLSELGFEGMSYSVIKNTPPEGVYLASDGSMLKTKAVGGSYCYYDGNNDGTYEVIFTSEGDNVMTMSFDYNRDLRVIPDNEIEVYNSYSDFDNNFKDPESWLDLSKLYSFDYVKHHKLIHTKKFDKEGTSTAPMSMDAFFEVWKLEPDIHNSSPLLREAEDYANDMYWENFDAVSAMEDIAWQVASYLAGCIPYVGPVGYVGVQLLHSSIDLAEQNNAENSYNFYSQLDEVSVSEKPFWDKYFGDDVVINTFAGQALGTFTTVTGMTEDTKYSAELILAPYGYKVNNAANLATGAYIANYFGGAASSALGSGDTDVLLHSEYVVDASDYALTAKSITGFSDYSSLSTIYALDPTQRSILENFISAKYCFKENTVASGGSPGYPPSFYYGKNTMPYLEYQMRQASSKELDRIAPFSSSELPYLSFVSSDSIDVPDFRSDQPIYIPSFEDSNLATMYADNAITGANTGQLSSSEYYPVYKVVGSDDFDSFDVSEIRFLPSRIDQDYTLQSVHLYAYDGEGVSYKDIPIDVDLDCYEGGALDLSRYAEEIYDDYLAYEYDYGRYHYSGSYYLIVEGRFSKYEELDKSNSNEVRACIMQACEAMYLEYFFQLQVGLTSVSASYELATIITQTLISTAITYGIGAGLYGKAFTEKGSLTASLGKEVSEEVFRDNFVDDACRNLAGDFGANEWQQMVAETVGESMVDQVTGIGGQIRRAGKSQSSSQNAVDTPSPATFDDSASLENAESNAEQAIQTQQEQKASLSVSAIKLVETLSYCKKKSAETRPIDARGLLVSELFKAINPPVSEGPVNTAQQTLWTTICGKNYENKYQAFLKGHTFWNALDEISSGTASNALSQSRLALFTGLEPMVAESVKEGVGSRWQRFMKSWRTHKQQVYTGIATGLAMGTSFALSTLLPPLAGVGVNLGISLFTLGMTKSISFDNSLRNAKEVNPRKNFGEVYVEKTVGPPTDPITIQYHEGMTAGEIATAIADVLSLEESDFHLSLEGITLGSEAIVPANVKLLLMPSSTAGAPQNQRIKSTSTKDVIKTNDRTENKKWKDYKKLFLDRDFKSVYKKADYNKKMDLNNKILGLNPNNKIVQKRIDKFNNLEVEEWFNNFHKDLRYEIRERLQKSGFDPSVIAIGTGITKSGFIKHIVAVEGTTLSEEDGKVMSKIIQRYFGVDDIIIIAVSPKNRKFIVPSFLSYLIRENHAEVKILEKVMSDKDFDLNSKFFLTTDKQMCVTCQITRDLFIILNEIKNNKISVETYEDWNPNDVETKAKETLFPKTWTETIFKQYYYEHYFKDLKISDHAKNEYLNKLWNKYKNGEYRNNPTAPLKLLK